MWPIELEPFSLYRGDTWQSPPIRLTEIVEGEPGPVDVAGWEWRAILRVGSESVPLTVTVTEAPAAGGMAAATVFVLSLTAAQTATVTRSGAWDLEGTHTDGTVRTWFRGTITHTEDITK